MVPPSSPEADAATPFPGDDAGTRLAHSQEAQHDGALLRAHLAGGPGAEDAFAAVVQRHLPMVQATCGRCLGSPLADDAVQTTFLVLLRKARTLVGHADVGRWLYFTARNVALTLQRSEARRRRHERQTMVASAADDDPTWAHIAPQLDAALSRLPRVQREAIVVHVLCGRTLAEAAHELGCPLRTLQTRVARGLARLRADLGTHVPASVPAWIALLQAHVPPATPSGLVRHLLMASHSATTKSLTAGAGGLLASAIAGAVGTAAVATLAVGVSLHGHHPSAAPAAGPPSHLVVRAAPLHLPVDGAFGAAFTPDGRALLSGGAGCCLWDTAAWAPGTTLGGIHRVDGVAVARDGTRLAGVDLDGTVHLWDRHGQPQAVGHSGQRPLWAVAFAPDGRTLVSGGDDTTVRVWETATGSCRRILRGHQSAVFCVAITRDGGAVASGSTDDTVRLWRLEDGALLWSHACGSNLHGLCFLPDGRTLAIAGVPGTLLLLDVRTGATLAALPTGTERLNALCLSQDDRWLVLASEDGQVLVWDAATRSEAGRIRLERGIQTCAMAPDDRLIVLGGWGSMLTRVDFVPPVR